MTTPPIEAVVAGTRGFALALVAPIAERLGTRPRLATDPAHALVFCSGPRAIVVVEFLGEDSLGAVKDLVLEGEGVRIVAAVPGAHAAAEAPLLALGVDPVRWDGRPEAILAAIDRQIAAVEAAAAAPRPAAPVRAAPGIGAAPARAPSAKSAAKSSAATAPTTAPRSPAVKAPGAVPPAPPAPAAPFAPLGGGPLDGLDGELEAAVDALGAGAPQPGPAPRVPAAGGDLFGDLEGGDDQGFDVDVDEAGADAAAAPGPGGPWPTGVPGPVEAADALGRALAGEASTEGTADAAAAVVAGLCDLERAVFSGEPKPFDTEPVRRAAVMRVRVAAALASAPGPGGDVDAAAVSTFLAEIDALLSDVSALAADAPPAVSASLEAVRNALVREAIDFSEAAQRASPAEALAPPPPAPRARAAQARVLSMSATRAEEPARPRQRVLAASLVVAVLAAAAFHGYRWWSAAARLREAPTLSGWPAGAIGPPADMPNLAAAPKVLTRADGEVFDADELEAFAAKEAQAGNTVQEIAPGAILVVPGNAGPPPAARQP